MPAPAPTTTSGGAGRADRGVRRVVHGRPDQRRAGQARAFGHGVELGLFVLDQVGAVIGDQDLDAHVRVTPKEFRKPRDDVERAEARSDADPHSASWLHLVAAYMPYQWLLGYAAFRAVWRQLRGVNIWEKTTHTGAAHRSAASMLEGQELGAGG